MARYKIYNDGENNGYDDSDFYYMALDTKENKVIKHVHSSTRHAGFSPLEDSEMCLNDSELIKRVENIICKGIDTDLSKFEIFEGDTVKVTNPRVRNFKGVEFEVLSMRRYQPYTPYVLYGDGIHSAMKNCEVIKLGYEHKQLIISQRMW